jgi:pimeloyl-ACP methyl ester carboxylesterase
MKLKDMIGYILNVRKPGAAEAFIATAKGIIPRDIDKMVAFYKTIRVPTLVIWGKQDGVIPVRFGERLTQEIPNSLLHVVDYCRHTPQEEHPEETLQAIREFLESLDSRNL